MKRRPPVVRLDFVGASVDVVEPSSVIVLLSKVAVPARVVLPQPQLPVVVEQFGDLDDRANGGRRSVLVEIGLESYLADAAHRAPPPKSDTSAYFRYRQTVA